MKRFDSERADLTVVCDNSGRGKIGALIPALERLARQPGAGTDAVCSFAKAKLAAFEGDTEKVRRELSLLGNLIPIVENYPGKGKDVLTVLSASDSLLAKPYGDAIVNDDWDEAGQQALSEMTLDSPRLARLADDPTGAEVVGQCFALRWTNNSRIEDELMTILAPLPIIGPYSERGQDIVALATAITAFSRHRLRR